MKFKPFLLILLLLFAQFSYAQKKLVRARSKTVDIKVGDNLMKGQWTISPEIDPDVYTTSAKGSTVTFYTDIDSVSVKITATTSFDFVVLLNDSIKAKTRIQYEPGYLDKLQAAATYDLKDNRPIPKFEYQDMNTPELVTLRKELNLDSIAGQGNQTLKVLNLLHWIHNLIPHDGQHDNPVIKNAMSMIRQCKKEERGLNCRGLATVLNECYLSLGMKSRFATCMPKDSVFDDCHVINMVYIEDAGKWVWIDPTNNAYVMDEQGELLGIEEVRERVINGKPLILNPDANWNNKSSTTKDYYLYNYMAKNLYRIECPLVSQYDAETWKQGKQVTYVELLPLDAWKQKPDSYVSTNQRTGTVFTYYKTNNPRVFWQKPE